MVELLVVIAIILVLAGMLLPALSLARSKAREISCMSQLKQIGQATAYYVEDFRSYPPGVNGTETFANCLRDHVYPLVEPPSPIFDCPDSNKALVIHHLTYAAHPLIMPDLASGKQPAKPGAIRRTSNVIMFLESCQLSNGHCDGVFDSVPGSMTDGVEANSQNPVVGDFDAHNQDGVDANAGWTRWRHHKDRSMNTVYFDGHATTLRKGNLREDQIKINY